METGFDTSVGLVMLGDAAPGPALRARRGKNIRARKLKEHQARTRDAVVPPLRNGADSYVAELRNFGTAAECINDLVRVHDTNLSALRINSASISSRVTQIKQERGTASLERAFSSV